jgi:hypothetical protein
MHCSGSSGVRSKQSHSTRDSLLNRALEGDNLCSSVSLQQRILLYIYMTLL